MDIFGSGPPGATANCVTPTVGGNGHGAAGKAGGVCVPAGKAGRCRMAVDTAGGSCMTAGKADGGCMAPGKAGEGCIADECCAAAVSRVGLGNGAECVPELVDGAVDQDRLAKNGAG